MNIAILVISSLSLLASAIVLLLSYKRRYLDNAFVYGINQTLIDIRLLYAYNQYFLSFAKVSLDNLERVNEIRLKKATDAENYSDAAYYRDLIMHISELKKLEAKDIENYGEQE